MWLLEAASLSASALEWCDYSEEVQLNFAALKASWQSTRRAALVWAAAPSRLNVTVFTE